MPCTRDVRNARASWQALERGNLTTMTRVRFTVLAVVFAAIAAAELNPEWIHWPAANIEHVAQHIIESWGLQPNNAMQATCEDTRA